MFDSQPTRLLALTLCIIVANPALIAQNPIVEDVEIRGYRTVSIQEIRKHIKTLVGEKFDPEQVRRDLESVMSIGKFDKARSTVVADKGPRDGVVVIFKLIELE